jgi:hypothetical protein
VNDLRERQAEELKEIRERQAEDLKEIRERQAEDLKEMLPLSKTNLKWSSQSSFLLWPLSEAVTCWFLAAGRALSSK